MEHLKRREEKAVSPVNKISFHFARGGKRPKKGRRGKRRGATVMKGEGRESS